MAPAPLHSLAVDDVERIVYHVYLSCISAKDFHSDNSDWTGRHFCSPSMPCRWAQNLLAPLLSLRLVDTTWNGAVKNFQTSQRETFFSPVEDGVYYPHKWHLNTRMRKALLLSRYRIFQTISCEDGKRGVFLAYDTGGAQGCAATARPVIIKAWVTDSDFEFQNEISAYHALVGASVACPGISIPQNHSSESAAYDEICDVYVLVLPQLGPTLQDLAARLPNQRFDAPMVLTVAIELIDRYRDIHARGIIHNGVKPANICMAPAGLESDSPSMLYVIDFGFASILENTGSSPLPSAHRIDTVGSRQYISVFAHHGISQSQRDDLESLAYLFSYLFHAKLPWDSSPTKLNGRASDRSQITPHIWRVKIATPASVLFRDMDDCFVEFWKDVKGLAYGEVPDYDKMKNRFVACLEKYNTTTPTATTDARCDWWNIWDNC
ncbi:kinase domain-containing protein [Favolaschia claudopus]|uniref:Kinase domain-containing protein n=1 Tax=Favolaschia claudopus TaxID=2862362 RepID=A0AAW0DH10_9AGAR